MGACKWELSHENNNFKISIDWQTYAVANEGQDWLPLAKNHVIGIHWKADFIIDGDAAREHRLELSIPNGITAEFSGRLDV